MRIAVGCDHAGFPYKDTVLQALRDDGHTPTDLGTDSADPVDYPDYARAVGLAVRDGAADGGVLICGSGAGVAIAANKIRGVRAALCHDLFTARQSREDDDANVLCLGARVISRDEAVTLVLAFFGSRFSREPRHERRRAKILALEAGMGLGVGEGSSVATTNLAGSRAYATPARAPESPPVTAALERLEHADAGRRLWRRDAGLWSADPGVRAAIEKRLGWLGSPLDMVGRLGEIMSVADAVRRDGIRDVVLLGMGGSSLAAEVFARTFPPPPGAPALTVLDTTDPGAIRAVSARLKLRETLFLVSSKSGTTTEMLALYRHFREQVEHETATPGAHFAAITDPGTPLARLATEAGFRKTFLNAPDIGGRFSALSYFGLVPAALVGVDVAGLLDRARAMAAACGPDVPVAENPGLRLGAALAGWAQAGRDKVTLVISPGVAALGAWLEQLLTESTGKQGRGLVAVVDEPPGPPAVYGADRVFVALGLGHDPALDRAVAPLEAAGFPVIRLGLGDTLDVGGEFFRWEIATAAAGVVLGLNPFDEPNVAQAKDATQAALATYQERGRLPEWPVDGVDEAARALAEARPGDYVALLAYVTPTPDTTAALQALRVFVRDRTRLATTAGYGPRYLHSTGQLHKGGPPTPIALILTAEPADDLPIPGDRYGFATLELAQALGDLATLRAANRRALWLPLAGDVPGALTRLTTELTRRLR